MVLCYSSPRKLIGQIPHLIIYFTQILTQLYMFKDVHFIVDYNVEKLDTIQIPISRGLFK